MSYRILQLSALTAALALGSTAGLVQAASHVGAPMQGSATASTPDARSMNATPANATTSSPRADAKSDSRTAQVSGAASLVVLMPMAQAGDTQLGNGCWVRFYDGKNFRGTNLTLVGPVDMPNTDVPGGVWREWDSAIVGPKATVVTFDNENYRDRTARLAAGQRITDLGDKKLGWFEEIKSARVSCAS